MMGNVWWRLDTDAGNRRTPGNCIRVMGGCVARLRVDTARCSTESPEKLSDSRSGGFNIKYTYGECADGIVAISAPVEIGHSGRREEQADKLGEREDVREKKVKEGERDTVPPGQVPFYATSISAYHHTSFLTSRASGLFTRVPANMPSSRPITWISAKPHICGWEDSSDW